jgi:hypothetical protein
MAAAFDSADQSTRHFNHKREHFAVDVVSWHVRTPTCEMARNACIQCLEQSYEYIAALSDEPRKQGISARKSAQQFVLECIAYGPCDGRKQPSIDDKYNAIIWCLNRQFLPCLQIFEFEKRYTPDMLGELARRGIYPQWESFDWYVENNKWAELMVIRNNTKGHAICRRIDELVKAEFPIWTAEVGPQSTPAAIDWRQTTTAGTPCNPEPLTQPTSDTPSNPDPAPSNPNPAPAGTRFPMAETFCDPAPPKATLGDLKQLIAQFAGSADMPTTAEIDEWFAKPVFYNKPWVARGDMSPRR